MEVGRDTILVWDAEDIVKPNESWGLHSNKVDADIMECHNGLRARISYTVHIEWHYYQAL